MDTSEVISGAIVVADGNGISDDDIRHAFEHGVAAITVPDRADFSIHQQQARSAPVTGVWGRPVQLMVQYVHTSLRLFPAPQLGTRPTTVRPSGFR